MTRNYIISLIFTINFTLFAAADEEQRPRIPRNLTARAAAQNRADNIPAEIANDALSREQQLIFGLVVLNRRHPMFRDDGYAYYLRELLSVTGFSADEAKVIIEKFKNNPEKYLSVLEKIKQNLASNNE